MMKNQPDLTQMRFVVKAMCSSEALGMSESLNLKDSTVKINGVEYYTNSTRIRQISKTIRNLSADQSTFIAEFPRIDQSFITLFMKALTGDEDVEMNVAALRWLSELWLHFKIDGKVRLKDKTVIQELEETLENTLNPGCWKEIIEFASAMELSELLQSCFKLLFQCEFEMLKKLNRKLDISDRNFEGLLHYIHKRAQSNTISALKFNLPSESEVFKFIETQYPTESDGIAAIQKRLALKCTYRTLSGENQLDNGSVSLEVVELVSYMEKEDKKLRQRLNILEKQLAVEHNRISQLEAKCNKLEELLQREICTISRFPRYKDFGWKNENNIDGVSFSVNKNIRVVAFGMYMPLIESVSGKLKFCEGSDCLKGVVLEIDVTMVPEKRELMFPNVKKIKLPEPVECLAGKSYTCAVQLKGGETWWGISGLTVVVGEKGVVFTFKDAVNSYSTNITSGQFPLIYYEV